MKFGQLTRASKCGEAWLWRSSSWQVGTNWHVRVTNTAVRSGLARHRVVVRGRLRSDPRRCHSATILILPVPLPTATGLSNEAMFKGLFSTCSVYHSNSLGRKRTTHTTATRSFRWATKPAVVWLKRRAVST